MKFKYFLLIFLFFLIGSGLKSYALAQESALNFIAPSLNGEKVNFKDYWQVMGKKVVLLSFFATWCRPCRAEVVDLQELQERYNNLGLQVVILSVDQGLNQEKIRQKIKNYMSGVNVDLPVLLDRFNIIKGRYGVFALPSNILIDHNGVIVARHTGYNETIKTSLENRIINLLSEKEKQL